MATSWSRNCSIVENHQKMGNRQWRQLLSEMTPLCEQLIEAEALLQQQTQAKTIQKAKSTRVENGHHKETAPIVTRLREIVATVDHQMLNVAPVNPARMWANTFCTPMLEQRNLFDMSIFGFRFSGSQIPMHDHPKMFGFIRPLFGRVRISSYTWLDPNEEAELMVEHGKRFAGNKGIVRPVKFEDQIVLSATNDSSKAAAQVGVLEPNTANLHTIEALDDGAAFFDLLVPGYDNQDRTCTYYSIIGSQAPSADEIIWLHGSEDTPAHFTMQRIEPSY